MLYFLALLHWLESLGNGESRYPCLVNSCTIKYDGWFLIVFLSRLRKFPAIYSLPRLLKNQ